MPALVVGMGPNGESREKSVASMESASKRSVDRRVVKMRPPTLSSMTSSPSSAPPASAAGQLVPRFRLRLGGDEGEAPPLSGGDPRSASLPEGDPCWLLPEGEEAQPSATLTMAQGALGAATAVLPCTGTAALAVANSMLLTHSSGTECTACIAISTGRNRVPTIP